MFANHENINRKSSKGWIQSEKKGIKLEACLDQPGILYNPYKLHVSIHSGVRSSLEAQIIELLDDALEKEIIDSYKLAEPSVRKNQNFRADHFPIVIYLKKEFNSENFKEVLLLCKKIEELLAGVEPGDLSLLSPCDLPFSDHLTFRQAARNGKKEYIEAEHKDTELVKQLREQGLQSQYFKEFKKGMVPASSPLDEKNREKIELKQISQSEIQIKVGIENNATPISQKYLIKLFEKICAEENVDNFRLLINSLKNILQRSDGPKALQYWKFGDLLWVAVRKLLLRGMLNDANFILKKCPFLMEKAFSNRHEQILQEGYAKEIRLLIQNGLNPFENPDLIKSIIQEDNLIAFQIFYEYFPDILKCLPQYQRRGYKIAKFIGDIWLKEQVAFDLVDGIKPSSSTEEKPEFEQLLEKFAEAKIKAQKLKIEFKGETPLKCALKFFGPPIQIQSGIFHRQTHAEKQFYDQLVKQQKSVTSLVRNEIVQQLLLNVVSNVDNMQFLSRLNNFKMEYLQKMAPFLSTSKLPMIRR